MNHYDVAVVGAGPAGLICAGHIAKSGKTVALLESNDKVGRKLLITGKGRCNITNLCDREELIASVTKNEKFMFSAFSQFSNYDTIDFFETLGVPTKLERGNRVFPVSDKAVDVVDCLYGFVVDNGVEIIHQSVVDLVVKDNRIVSVVTDECEISADDFVIATGGKSYPKTGSTGDGYKFAKKCGHTIVPPVASLVPLNVREGSASAMQGLSLKNVATTVEDTRNNKIIYKDFGEMLFTHFGLSGPMILSASAHMKDVTDGKYKVHIDLKPALEKEKLDKRILREFTENNNKNLSNVVAKLLPAKAISVIIKNAGLNQYDKVNQITKEQRNALVDAIKCLTFTVTSLRPIEEAIVTSGGVDCKEIYPKSMRSKICENLYFAGEVIDVDAYTGGFNLQIAFSTGFAAAQDIIKK